MSDAPIDEAKLKAIRILLVEDSGIQAKVFVDLLKRCGFINIAACANANHGLKYLEEQPADIIFCDWQMPMKSGLEFLQELRAIPTHKSIPFLFLTASGEKQRVIEALKSGATDYILKPATAELLQDKIRGLVAAGKVPL